MVNLSFFEDSRQICVVHDPNGGEILKLVLGHVRIADNGSRSRNRGIYIAVSLKTKFERHLPGEFHDCSWVF